MNLAIIDLMYDDRSEVVERLLVKFDIQELAITRPPEVEIDRPGVVTPFQRAPLEPLKDITCVSKSCRLRHHLENANPG